MMRQYAFVLLCLGVAMITQPISAQPQCERLKNTLTYTQKDAPRDLTKVISLVVEQVNKAIAGVLNVDVDWNGSDLHGRVGEHIINCRVHRLASYIPPEVLQEHEVYQDDSGREVASQCFQVPFTIYDTNECTLPQGHDMRHQCHEPSICVNTLGSYECLCPRIDGSLPPGLHVTEDSSSHTYSIDVAGEQEAGFFDGLLQEQRSPWELSMGMQAATSLCPSRTSTRGCCPEIAHSRDGQDCRSQFVCPMDPCSTSRYSMSSHHHNNCTANAQCVRTPTPQEHPNHICQCPEGLLGNGRACQKGDAKPEPKITFDGSATEETIKADFCGCTKPVVDACSGFPPCTNKHEVCVVSSVNTPKCGCKKGFVQHATYGCVDETPPTLRLNEDQRNDKTLKLKQGDFYKEYGVKILDANAEDYHRNLRISYSEPLPQGCLYNIGEFTVNYTVSTPWTDPSSVWVARRVVIDDIDECSLNMAKYETTCPPLVPRCDIDAGAKCTNTVGSYACECPKFTTGDGFLSGSSFMEDATPDGYQGGTGCRDTSKPVIELKGPNPKIFKICPCGGIKGVMGDNTGDDDGLLEAQREHYESDIKDMIKATQGAELCATHDNTRPRPGTCANAYDETYEGKVDLSSRVKIGDPVKRSDLHWSIPYYVKDKAGNEAKPVWRDVVVEEVDFEAMESKIRQEVASSKDAEIKEAVAKAVRDERKKLQINNNSREKNAQDCPACPVCGESTISKALGGGKSKGKIDISICDKICDERAQQCTLQEQTFVIRALLVLEEHLPAEIVPILLLTLFVSGAIFVLRLVILLVFYPGSFSNSYDYASEQERERSLQNAVTYYQGGTPQPNQQNRQQTPHNNGFPQTVGGSVGATPGPPRSSMTINQGSDFFLSPPGSAGAGFASPPGTNGTQQQPNHDDPNGIYMSPPIIRPSPKNNGSELRRRSPGGF